MKFVAGGPDVCEELIIAHEAGKVVFFIGAGVSANVGLPTFGALVELVAKSAGDGLTTDECADHLEKKFDRVLGAMEVRLGPARVRELVAEILRPESLSQSDLASHRAILELSRARSGAIRLVTTNFDPLFELALEPSTADFAAAPLLPVPKSARWDSVVHIHGRLPKTGPAKLHDLVLTAGDFGRAYLTERWASRFVTELFRNFTVCLIGYSLDDPVLRYLVDAVAADRNEGEPTPRPYAFVSVSDSARDQMDAARKWNGIGITPIPYAVMQVDRTADDHSLLHSTLIEWAHAYRAGADGREAVAERAAMTDPTGLASDSETIARVLWALSDPSGLPAKRFANAESCPSLAWLDVFERQTLSSAHLAQLGVATAKNPLYGSSQTLTRRVMSPEVASLTGPFSPPHPALWDAPLSHLATWLGRLAGDPQLLFRLSQLDCIHPHLYRVLEGAVAEDATLKLPKGLRIAWQALLVQTDRAAVAYRQEWQLEQLLADVTARGRLGSNLEHLMAPKLVFTPKFGVTAMPEDPQLPAEFCRWDYRLRWSSPEYCLDEWAKSSGWASAWRERLVAGNRCLEDLTSLSAQLTSDARATELSARVLSIVDLGNGQYAPEWAWIIKVLRDAWKDAAAADSIVAGLYAREWMAAPALLTQRLGIFAATHTSEIRPTEWTSWISRNLEEILASPWLLPEIYALVIGRGKDVETPEQERLIALLSTALDDVLRAADSDEHVDRPNRRKSRSIWLLTSAIREAFDDCSGSIEPLLQRLTEYDDQFDRWATLDDAWWIRGAAQVSLADEYQQEVLPRDAAALEQRMLTPRQREPFATDDWEALCVQEPSLAIELLAKHRKVQTLGADRWQSGLYAVATLDPGQMPWGEVFDLLKSLEIADLAAIAYAAAHLLLKAVESGKASREDSLHLGTKLISALQSAESLSAAADAPSIVLDAAWMSMRAVLLSWFMTKPVPGEELPTDLADWLNEQLLIDNANTHQGLLAIGQHLSALLTLAPVWSANHLIPRFDSQTPTATWFWHGYLRSATLTVDVLSALSPYFVKAMLLLTEENESRPQFTRMMTVIGLERRTLLPIKDLKLIFRSFPIDDLTTAVWTIERSLSSRNDQAREFARLNVRPFLDECWPRERSGESTESLSLAMCRLVAQAAATGEDLLPSCRPWLRRSQQPYSGLHSIDETGMSSTTPHVALVLMNLIVADGAHTGDTLRKLLDEVAASESVLRESAEYSRLNVIAKLNS